MTRCWYASRRFVYLFAFILSAKVLIFACRVTLLSHRIREVQNLLYHLSMGLKICSLVTQSYKPFGKGQMFFLFFSYVYARGVKFYRTAIIKIGAPSVVGDVPFRWQFVVILFNVKCRQFFYMQ